MRAFRSSARLRRRSRVAALLAVLAVVAGACGGGAGDTSLSPLDEVRVALRQRAALLATGDVDGYLATVGPRAMDVERAVAEGAAGVPLSYANATVTPKGSRTATSLRNALVEVVYRYDDLPPDNLFRFSLSYDLDKRQGRWIVVTSELVADDGSPPAWTTGPIEAERSDHFLSLHRPGLPKASEALAVAERARTDLAERFDAVHSDPVHLLLLAGSEDEYATFKGGPTKEGELASAGFLFLPLSKAENRFMLVKAHRLIDETSTAESEDGLRAPPKVVFQHELGHLALTRLDGPYTPGWVNEGAAMYLAGERRMAPWMLGLEEGLFDDVSIEAIANDESMGGGVQYAYVNAAVLYLVETFGVDRFFEFYARFLPLGATAEFAADATGVVLQETYEISVSDLDSRTRAYMQKAVAAG